jgi:hypothetical protein
MASARRLSVVPDFRYDFYDAKIIDAKLGPRREIALHFQMWPEGTRPKGVVFDSARRFHVVVRCGSIMNMKELESFFTSWSTNRNYGNGLHYLRASPESKPGHLLIKLQFDRTDDELVIHCGSVTITKID